MQYSQESYDSVQQVLRNVTLTSMSSQNLLLNGMQLKQRHQEQLVNGRTQKKMADRTAKTSHTRPDTTQVMIRLRLQSSSLSALVKETQGSSVKESRTPEMMPVMWAQLSTHGSSPRTKAANAKPIYLHRIRQGCLISDHDWKNSVKVMPSRAKWEAVGPAST